MSAEGQRFGRTRLSPREDMAAHPFDYQFYPPSATAERLTHAELAQARMLRGGYLECTWMVDPDLAAAAEIERVAREVVKAWGHPTGYGITDAMIARLRALVQS